MIFFSTEEIRNAVKLCKTKNLPRLDNILPDMIKCSNENIFGKLTSFLKQS